MTDHRTDYEVFEASSIENRRGLRQEELILEVTEAIAEMMHRQGVTRSQLAKKLGRSRGFVSQILAGGRNLTLRTLADVADALDCRVRVHLARYVHARAQPSDSKVVPWPSRQSTTYQIVEKTTGAMYEPVRYTQGAA